MNPNSPTRNRNYQFNSPRSIATSSTFPATFAQTPVNLIQRSQLIKFYLNQIKCEPMGDKIEIILSHWFGDYRRLESNHGYIQWLFPTFSQGQNYICPPLKDEEARCIYIFILFCFLLLDLRTHEECINKMQKAFEMMLDFYGMKWDKYIYLVFLI